MDYTHVFAVCANEADLWKADFIVNTRSGVALWRRIVRSAGYGIYPLIAIYLGVHGILACIVLQAPNRAICALRRCFPLALSALSEHFALAASEQDASGALDYLWGIIP